LSAAVVHLLMAVLALAFWAAAGQSFRFYRVVSAAP